MFSQLQKEFEPFMALLESRLNEIDLDINRYPIDHICYRVESIKQFNEITDLIKHDATIWSEKFFNDRIFNTIVLREPLAYKNIYIPILEISQPGGSDNYTTGFQHIELLTYDTWQNTGIPEHHITRLIAKSKYGNEIYLKWDDKMVIKSCKRSVLISAFTEDNPKIYLAS